MSNLILPRRMREPTGPRNQRGFIINPYALEAAGSGGWAVNMPFSGANGSTVFTDLSGKVWTVSGTPVAIDTSLGYNTGYFHGGWLTTPNHADFDLGTNDFRIQGYVRPTLLTDHQAIIAKWATGSTDQCWFILYSANGSFRFTFREAGGTARDIISSAGILSAGVEAFFEVTRVGSAFTLKLNGSTVGGATYAAAVRASTNAVYMGASEASGVVWRMDAKLRGNLQLKNGSAAP